MYGFRVVFFFVCTTTSGLRSGFNFGCRTVWHSSLLLANTVPEKFQDYTDDMPSESLPYEPFRELSGTSQSQVGNLLNNQRLRVWSIVVQEKLQYFLDDSVPTILILSLLSSLPAA